jgi:hypothetical protein
MPVILAVEPDRKQAARLAAIVRHQVGAELVLADTTERALDALGARIPDMVLVPALLSPQDDASLAAALRVIAAAAHVRTLTIPVLASGSQQEERGGFLSRWRRGRAESPELDGCDPAVFAEQITAYLQEAAAERIEMGETAAPIVAIPDPAPVDTVSAETLSDGETLEFEAMPEARAKLEVEAMPDVEAVPEARTMLEFEAMPEVGATFEEEIPTEEPTLDLSDDLDLSDELVGKIELSDELVALSDDDTEEELFAGEPFGTYTLPSVDEIEPETAALLEAAASETRVVSEPPVASDHPVMFESPVVVESFIDVESPAAFERPVAWEPPVACEPPVVFEPPAVFEPAVAFEAPAAGQAPVVFEHPAVLELMGPVPMTPWHAWPPLEGVPIEVSGVAAAKPDVPDWSALMASLREDMDRRRGQERPAALKQKPRLKAEKPAVDEWGFFDPEQCGFSALLAKLDEITSP